MTHLPQRGDEVEKWLLRQRDQYRRTNGPAYVTINGLLNHYRMCADYGIPLDDEEGGDP